MKIVQDLIIIFVMLLATFCIVFYCHAETITIPPEDMKDSTIAHLQSQLTDQNIIIKNWLPKLLQKTGCKPNDKNELVCPDEKKDEPKKSN